MARRKFEYQVYKHCIDETVNKTWDCDDDGLWEALDLIGSQGYSLVSITPLLTVDGEVKILQCVSMREVEEE